MKCGRCGRKLKNEESKERGLGPVCYAKLKNIKKSTRLFEVKKHAKRELQEEQTGR